MQASSTNDPKTNVVGERDMAVLDNLLQKNLVCLFPEILTNLNGDVNSHDDLLSFQASHPTT